MGPSYNSVVGFINGNSDSQQARTANKRKFNQIKRANEDIQGILNRRVQISNNPNDRERQRVIQDAPRTKLKVKTFPIALQKHTIKVSKDFQEISFQCSIFNKYLCKSYKDKPNNNLLYIDMYIVQANKNFFQKCLEADDEDDDYQENEQMNKMQQMFQNQNIRSQKYQKIQEFYQTMFQIGVDRQQQSNNDMKKIKDGFKVLIKKEINLECLIEKDQIDINQERCNSKKQIIQIQNENKESKNFAINFQLSDQDLQLLKSEFWKKQSSFLSSKIEYQNPQLALILSLRHVKIQPEKCQITKIKKQKKQKKFEIDQQIEIDNINQQSQKNHEELVSNRNEQKQNLENIIQNIISVCYLDIGMEKNKNESNNLSDITNISLIGLKQRLFFGKSLQEYKDEDYINFMENLSISSCKKSNQTQDSYASQSSLVSFEVSEVYKVDPQSHSTKKAESQEAEESDPSSPCVICFCMPKSTILLPCRHFCICEYCADKIKSFSQGKCPICRQQVTRYIEVESDITKTTLH